MNVRVFCMTLAAVSLVFACNAERLKIPYFGKDLSAAVTVLDGKPETLSLETSGSEVKLISNNGFNGFVGLELEAEQLTWRQYYHWWNIALDLSGRTKAGGFALRIRCYDAQGELLEDVSIYESPFSEGRVSEHIRKSCFPVPKCRINDPAHPVAYFSLGLSFSDWKGVLIFSGLTLEKYELTEQDRRPFILNNNSAKVGAMAWFDPSYCPLGTASEGLRDTAHKLFAAAGINKMRFMAVWGDHFRKHVSFRIEPTFEVRKGEYDFEKLDHYLDELDYYGNSIGVLTLWGTPEWAHTKTSADIPAYKLNSPRAAEAIDNATFPPDDWDDYRNFVTKMVRRYKGRIEAYEVWNEPDVWQYGMTYGYESYIDYLKNFHTAAKKADPACKVYAGRIAMWLVPCIRQGRIQDYCDAVADHPYPGRMAGWSAAKTRMEELIKCMISQNVVKPLIVTEVGLGAGYPWPGPGGFPGEEAKAYQSGLLADKLSEYTPEIYWYTPIQSGRAYGILHYTHDRYRPNPVYYTFAEHNGRLNNDLAPVKARVVLPKIPVKHNQPAVITLTAENTSDRPQVIRFWPVGLIDDLGFTTFDSIRTHDRDITLEPGASHSEQVTITPSESASGKYPLGLAVINEQANSLALEEVPVWSVAAAAQVSASSRDEGSVEAVNSLFEPVWSGDIDIPRLLWKAQSKPRTEWVRMQFDGIYEISSVSVYWVANPRPKMFFPELEYNTIVLPEEWKVFYRSNDTWIPVRNQTPYETKVNEYGEVRFAPVRTSEIKIEAVLKPGKAAGILQIKVK